MQVGKVALPALVTAVCLLLSFDAMVEFFIYRRSAFFAGEYWRLVTGSFIHTNWQHLLLNLVAWLLIWVYGTSVCAISTWLLAFSVCTVGVGVGLLLWLPEIEAYSGLSGVLHGLLVVVSGVRLLVWRSDYSAWAVLAIVVAKLAYELSQAGSGITGEWIGLPIVFEAHLYGAVSGAVVIMAMILVAMIRKRNKGVPGEDVLRG